MRVVDRAGGRAVVEMRVGSSSSQGRVHPARSAARPYFEIAKTLFVLNESRSPRNRFYLRDGLLAVEQRVARDELHPLPDLARGGERAASSSAMANWRAVS